MGLYGSIWKELGGLVSIAGMDFPHHNRGMDMRAVASTIRRQRKALGLTQGDLAALLGVNSGC